jgi:Calcineurin-like phosphoesterase
MTFLVHGRFGRSRATRRSRVPVSRRSCGFALGLRVLACLSLPACGGRDPDRLEAPPPDGIAAPDPIADAALSHEHFVPYEGGPPVTGAVGADGGTLSRLLFAVVGDTRPATVDDTAAYPVDVITAIYGDVAALEPRPTFVVSTGDYMFAATPPRNGDSQAGAQLDLYMQARARFPGALFPAMGNHECTGATSSNCGAGSQSGMTANYSAFLQAMLAPIRKAQPYYAIDVAAADANWTAKLVFVAANAWSAAQDAWLESTLARPSTYTFVVRHEPAWATAAPGVGPSERAMAGHPYTLAIVGHSHTYAHDRDAPREVLVGNGGAPLSSKDYGFAVFSQRADGAVAVDMLDWRTGYADAAFHFAVRADGGAAP